MSAATLQRAHAGTRKPATNVHSGAVAAALTAYAWFIVVAWIAFGRLRCPRSRRCRPDQRRAPWTSYRRRDDVAEHDP
jgi:hypothetical protein